MGQRVWMGNEWQNYCMLLLRQRYDNHTLQEVPDRHGGDLGIEAFSYDGCAFQCYAAEEPLSTAALYDAQRDKLTADLGKLKKNEAEFLKLFGDRVITRYVFMVHRLDSRRIVTHATVKAEDVRSWKLPFIADDFAIVVVTDEYYAKEREGVLSIPSQIVQSEPVDAEHVQGWSAENAPLVKGATVKLKGVGLESVELDRYLNALLSQYLEGENALQKLRQKYPDHWHAVSIVKSRKENRLALEYPPSSSIDASQVLKVLKDIVIEVRRDAPAVPEALAESIAWAAVADWLMRCPLRLGGAA